MTMNNNSARKFNLRPGPVLAVVIVALAISSTGCTQAPEPEVRESPQEGVSSFTGTWWRLQTLGGQPPVEGIRPVLIFTDEPAENDRRERPFTGDVAGWSLLRGESGVGPFHDPYRVSGDTLQIALTYELTRTSSPAEEDQARTLAEALKQARRISTDGTQLLLVSATGDTLATFTADPPRQPGAFDDLEWNLETIGGSPILENTRGTLTYTSLPIGPGPGEGFDRYEGYSGCNWFEGGYRSDGYRLTNDGPVTTTRRGCLPAVMEQEAAYQRALVAARLVRRDVDNLALLDSAGVELLRFTLQPEREVDAAALKQGRWRFISSTNEAAPADMSAEVAFADAVYEGTSGCRRFRGGYFLEGDNLSVSSMEVDDTRCSDAQRAQPFWVPIHSGDISVNEERLVLFDVDGREAVFVRP
jgi:heat shock protein HslJ